MSGHDQVKAVVQASYCEALAEGLDTVRARCICIGIVTGAHVFGRLEKSDAQDLLKYVEKLGATESTE